MKHFFFVSITIVLCRLFVGCSSETVVKEISAEEHFLKGKQLFEEESYFDAIEEFKTIGLQFSGSGYADDAEIYLGDCYFRRGEYVLAAYEYETLKKRMASSSLVPLAQYKLALSYYFLSPKSTLDQKYTAKAIDQFQAFLEYYPQHDSANIAAERIHRLNTRLAKREFEIASLYVTLEEYPSAQYYFEKILERFHDTEYAEQAQLGIVESWIARNKYGKAKESLDVFFQKYPTSQLLEKAKSLKDDIETHLQQQQSLDSTNEPNKTATIDQQ